MIYPLSVVEMIGREVSKQKIEKLEAAMSLMPQSTELKTEHYFADGMYCRKLFRPKHTLIVGKVHKKEHLFICASGSIRAWTENGMKTLNAGDVIESKPGTKRVTLALEDSIGMTIHLTNNTDLDEIEKELLEEAPISLFDARNNLKALETL